MTADRSSLWLAFVAALASACAGSRQAARFSGEEREPLVNAEQVQSARDIPSGATPIGEVEARCVLTEGRSAFEHAWLSDVDCTRSRLTWALREKAADVGGTMLFQQKCYSDVIHEGDATRTLAVACQARVARNGSGQTTDDLPGLPSGLSGRDDEPRASDAWRIRIDVRREGPAVSRPPLRADLVEEHAVAPVGRVVVGEISAQCETDCRPESVRAGLRAAAGRVGATDIAASRCSPIGDGIRCVATALAHGTEPELDPRLK